MRMLIVKCLLALNTELFLIAFTPLPELPLKDRPFSHGPDISGQCGWGVIVQEGRKVRIEEDGRYDIWASGEILPNGKLFLMWTVGCRVALALYEIEVSETGNAIRINGVWGWADEVNYNDSDLQGEIRSDNLR